MGSPVFVVNVHPGESAPMLVATGTPSEHPKCQSVFAFPGW